MSFLRTIINRYREHKREIDDTCKSYIFQINDSFENVNKHFVNKNEYIDLNIINTWRIESKSLHRQVATLNLKSLKRSKFYRQLLGRVSDFTNFPEQLRDKITKHNAKVLENRVLEAGQLIGEVEGRELDDQQMQCIVESASNHLVIAGAGTGKTTTIVGKVKYLVKSHQYQPNEILVLSFTNASASKVSDRLEMEVGQHIDAVTFHKLGLNILSSAEGKKPKITNLNLHAFIKEQIEKLIQDSHYLQKLNHYLLYGRTPEKSDFDFSTQEEYNDYLNNNPPITLKGETVKSYGELDIANFLFENQINYIYEAPYEIDTRDLEHGIYHPDFYLPDYQIYIEYFGINRQNQVPEYFHGKHGKSASEIYCESIKWKRDLHRQNHTTMVECFAYEKFEDKLLDNLRNQLEKHSVKLKPLNAKDLWAQVNHDDPGLNNLITLIETVINLIKSNNFTFNEVRQKNSSHINRVLLDAVQPIYDNYNQYLESHEEIDFHDMINKAARYVRDGKYVNKYKFVIVDEYQDISKSRFKLLESLRKSQDYKLFCVGDDWQSIYGFSGSDINFILNFESYWGLSVISKIETTYRFPPQLVEISSAFVMENPAQIQKQITSYKTSETSAFGIIQGYTENYAMKFALEKLDNLPKNSEVFFIGRYNSDSRILSAHDYLRYHYSTKTGTTKVSYLKRQDLHIEFLTAHKSKGLQADYVFIINNKNDKMGFPSKIRNASILDSLLENHDDYPYAEERRLFYVALTRAKEKTFLVTIKNNKSIFAQSLEEDFASEIKQERFECPECGGQLVRRKGPYGEFYGCLNYARTGCKYTRKTKAKNS